LGLCGGKQDKKRHGISSCWAMTCDKWECARASKHRTSHIRLDMQYLRLVLLSSPEPSKSYWGSVAFPPCWAKVPVHAGANDTHHDVHGSRPQSSSIQTRVVVLTAGSRFSAKTGNPSQPEIPLVLSYKLKADTELVLLWV
jgi:hypothetical protein